MFGDANVKLGKLKQQLVRDLKASPKKAAILGVLFLVAAWFWAPLLFGTSKNKSPSATEAVATATAGGDGTAVTASATVAAVSTADQTATPPAKHSWRQLMEVIENDPRMSAPRQTLLEFDPFRTLLGAPKPEVVEEVEEQPETAPPAAVTPESLGLVLSGTLIGTRGRVAIINGRPFGVGREIAVRENTFVVVNVTHKRAVLEREGQRILLETAPPAGTGTLEVRRDER